MCRFGGCLSPLLDDYALQRTKRFAVLSVNGA